MRKQVLAVIVTHNRMPLLKRCISFVKDQSYKPDLLVIDNSSTDGTKEFLISENIDHITQPNGGSSAGWWRSIDEAIKREYTYAWLMDDDGFPDHKALEHLVNTVNENTSCISSVIVKENNHTEFVFGLPKLNRKGNPVLLSFKRKYYHFDELPSGTITYPFAHLFNGALINISIAKKISNVNKDYFLYGDEVDYFCRLRKTGSVLSLLSALHYHPDVSLRKIDKIRVYYFVRNTIVLNKKYFDRVFLRNCFTIIVAWIRLLKRNGLWVSFTYILGSNAKYFYYGIKDGIKNNLIKRY